MTMDKTSQTYISFEAIIGFLSSLGNGLVLYAIYKNLRLQTVTNCFIASLSLADFLVGLIVAPLAALSYLGKPHHFLGCVFTNSIIIAFTQVSIFNLLAVAVERFFAIKHPFAYKEYLTIKRAIIVNIIVWFVGMLFGFIPLFGWNLKSEIDDNWTCNFVTVIDMKYVVYFHFFGCIIVPLIIIIAIYTYIFIIVRKQMSQIAALEVISHNQRNHSGRKLKKEIKAAKSLALVILLFAFCWIPIHILNSLTLICGSDCAYPMELLLVTIVLSHANSTINPFLYAYGNSNFKHAFKKMIGRSSENMFVTNAVPNHNGGRLNSSSLQGIVKDEEHRSLTTKASNLSNDRRILQTQTSTENQETKLQSPTNAIFVLDRISSLQE